MEKQMIEARLRELKANLQSGEQQLKQLQAKEKELQQTLLRIGGAIQVLEELLTEAEN